MSSHKLARVFAVLVGVLAFSAPILAEGEAQSTSATMTNSQTVTTPEDAKRFAGVVSVDHFLARRGYYDPLSQLTFDGFYYFPKKVHSLRLVQGLQKNWVTPQVGGNEFDFQDTLLAYYYRITPDFYGFELKVRGSGTLPLSRASRNKGLLTTTGAMFQVNRKFMNGALIVGYWPFFNYYWNEYSTSPSGNPIRQMAFGHWLVAKFHPIETVELSAALNGAYTVNQKAQFAPSRPPLSGIYEYDFYAGYEALKDVMVRIGYNHGTSFIKDGRYEVNLYDEAVSRIYFGVDIAL